MAAPESRWVAGLVPGPSLLPWSGIARAPPPGHRGDMEMRAEVVIGAAAGDAWVVVGELFGEIGGWASAITVSSMKGPPAAGQVRTCHVAGFGPVGAGVIRERLVSFDPAAMSLAYEAVEGMPALVLRAVSRWSVHPGPDGTCTVRIHATITLRRAVRPLGPVLRWRMRADIGRVLAELRHRVETGAPHAGKLAALAAGRAPR